MNAAVAAIVTRELSRAAGKKLLVDRLTLDVPQGAVFGLLGPNGAGKTTTLRILSGLLRPTSGEALVGGVSPWRDPERLKMLIGSMQQSVALYDYLTVGEHLAFFANLSLPSRRVAEDRAREVLAATGLEGYQAHRASQLSGGWRQRLALACAILHDPKILFLDEPTAGIDPVSRRMFWDLLLRLRAGGTTIVVTTHYMEEVERCDLVGLLLQGKLRSLGSPRELKHLAAADRELVSVGTRDPERALECLRGLEGLLDVYSYGDEIHVTWPAGKNGLERTRGALIAANLAAGWVECRGATMEDVFVRMSHEAPA
jgi:ABC-2 type transport system ATP-binding protein